MAECQLNSSDECAKLYHFSCVGLKEADVEIFDSNAYFWYCPICIGLKERGIFVNKNQTDTSIVKNYTKELNEIKNANHDRFENYLEEANKESAATIFSDGTMFPSGE